jgi:hypothetical protein
MNLSSSVARFYRNGGSRVISLSVLSLLLFAARVASGQPQLPDPPLPVDPTPLEELMSPSEKLLLTRSKEPKKLVEAYLHISDAHLDLALSTIKANDNKSAERELDIYNKAVAEATHTAMVMKDGRRAVSKKIEQHLYKQIRTLEEVERMFPPERIAFATAAVRHTKAMRVQALNAAFASGDVLKDPDAGDKKPKGDSPDKPDAAIGGRREWYQPFSSLVSIKVDPEMVSKRVWPSIQIAGDYLTEAEDDHVREAQSPDDRTKVFMKIAERRLSLITGPAPVLTEKPVETTGKKSDKKSEKAEKKAEEEEREWGTLPKLSRAELLRHYARAIEECTAKLEDAYERNPKAKAFVKALEILRDSTEKQLAILRPLTSQLTDEAEAKALADAIDQAEVANKGAVAGLNRK